jgi:hypothetical protein
MTHEDAKIILQAYRPDGSDARDADFCAALQLAREDPELAKWFERQQAFDRAFAAKLRAVEPPAELRTAILAGGRVSRGPRESWWRQPRWLALAASAAVLLAAGALFWPRQAIASVRFMAFVAEDARHSETHGGSGEPAGALQARLSEPTTRLGDHLGVDFDALHSTGCRSINFHGHEVLEVCFKRDGLWFHCYVARQVEFPSLALLAKPVITELDHVDVAAWADSSHVYLVVSDAGRTALQHLL